MSRRPRRGRFRLPPEAAITRLPWLLALVMVPGFLTYFGVYFDVSWHIDNGRDHFDIPPHMVMLVGVQVGGLMLAGLLVAGAVILARGGTVHQPRARWRHISFSPLVLVALACFMAPGLVLGLDEIWHRIFGLDVSAWSPTHLTALYTAAFAGLATAAFLAAELNRLHPDRASSRPRRLRDLHPGEGWLVYAIGLFGAGLLVMLIEFDFDVPQWSLSFYPPLAALLSSFAVFTGMAALGARFGATLTGAAIVGFKLVMFGLLALGRTQPDVAVGIVAGALAADLALLAFGERRRRAGMLAALAVYPVAMLGADWLRLELAGAPRWTEGLWPYGAPLAVPAGMVGGALGLWAGWALRPAAAPLTAPLPRADRRLLRRLIPAGLALLLLAGPFVPAALGHAGYMREIVLSRLDLSPARPAVGDELRVRLTVGPRSIEGKAPAFLEAPAKLGAFRAEDRHTLPLRRVGARSFEGRVPVDRPGTWVVWPQFDARDERWTDRAELEVAADRRPSAPSRSLLLAIGPEADPEDAPEWLYPAGFLVMAAIWLAVTVAVVRSLRTVARFGFGGTA